MVLKKKDETPLVFDILGSFSSTGTACFTLMYFMVGDFSVVSFKQMKQALTLTLVFKYVLLRKVDLRRALAQGPLRA